jgi:hypothetical protein
MIGLLGSGIDQTIVTQTPNVNTHTQATAEATGTNQLYMLNFTDCNNPEVAGFTLKGTDQSNAGATSQYYNGILFYNGTGGNVHDLKIVGAGPGYASAPPGETFLLNTNKQNSMTWSDIELDGRLNGTGTSTSSTNFSFNNATGNNVYRLYSHHTTYGAGTTQYQCNTTNYVDTRTTNCTKPQMNFERAGSSTGGVINIVRHNFDSSGTCQIAITSDTGWTTLNIYDPILTGISQIHLRAYTTYAGGTSIQRSHLGAINCWVGGSWDDVTKTYTGGTLRNDLLNVTT